MVKIKVADLKVFFAKAQGVKQNGIIPILDFIKITCEDEKCTITKNALSSFIIHTIEAKFKSNFTILVDENDLQASVNASDQEEIKITFKMKKVPLPGGGYKDTRIITIEDGHLVNGTFQGEDESLYPVTAEPGKDKRYNLTSDIVEALYTASSHTQQAKNGLSVKVENFVHVIPVDKKRSYICGYNNTIIYYKSFNEALPEMALEPSVCNIIGAYQAAGVEVIKGEKYIFIDTGTSLYGFSQTDGIKAPDFGMVVKMMDPSKGFAIDRKSLMSWCSYAVKVNPYASTEPCSMKNGEGDKEVIFDYEDSNTSRSCRAAFEVKKTKRYVVPKFLFNPNEMITILKGCVYEKVNLVGPCNGNLYITCNDDPDYVGAIRMIVLTNQPKEEVSNEQ